MRIARFSNVAAVSVSPECKNAIVIGFEDGEESVSEQAEVLLEALHIYSQRNSRYNEHWRDLGWRGCLFHVRRKAERAFRQFWNWNAVDPDLPQPVNAMQANPDDLYDSINYTAMAIRLLEEGTLYARDGTWWSQVS